MSVRRSGKGNLRGAAAVALAVCTASSAFAQSVGNRALGLDVSAHQANISQSTWTNIHNIDNIAFTFIRSSRGGTTGEDHRQGGYTAPNNTLYYGSQRYDDPYFV